MDSNDELKEINIKNRRCYYFDDIIKLELISIMFEQMDLLDFMIDPSSSCYLEVKKMIPFTTGLDIL